MIIPITVPRRPTRVPEGGHGSDDGEVLLQSRHFESGSLFNLLLESGDFLFLGQNGVLVHFCVADKSRVNNSCYRTFLLCAEGTSTGDVVLFEASLNTGNELGDVAFAFSCVEGDPALYSKYDYGKEESLEYGHDETAFCKRCPTGSGGCPSSSK